MNNEQFPIEFFNLLLVIEMLLDANSSKAAEHALCHFFDGIKG
jgi:hypothetical protein